MSAEPYLSRDAAVLVEGELRQFETKRMQGVAQGGILTVQRYVESLVTGEFWQVMSDVVQPSAGGEGSGSDDKKSV